VFENAYDRNSHIGFHRVFERISETLYLYHLAKRLRRYIKLCHICVIHQTKRHASYGQMVPIRPPDIPFHTIAIDFIDKLPPQKGLDALLSVTDKFTKRVLLISGKMTLTAEEWAVALMNALRSADWGILRAIISDRDSKFIGAFWKGAFKRLGTNMLITTAYHLQADGQSERTNQTMEIALRFIITNNPTTK
jgi:Integrase zinc binding domain